MNATVLIVDDSLTSRLMSARILMEHLGLPEDNIFQATQGQEALDMLQKQTFSLILMDWYMPGLSGLETIQSIRAAGVQTPIVMVTSEADQSAVISAIQAGANNYVIKPISKESLISKISPFLQPLTTP